MRRSNLPLVVIFLFLALMMTKCVYNDVPEVIIELPDTVSFSLDIIPIFDADCNSAGCHNEGGIRPDLSPGNAWDAIQSGDYLDLTDPAASPFVIKMEEGGSMAQYSNPQDVALITQWIAEGAKNN